MSDGLWHDRQGSGPTLVMLHGWALNSRVFDGLAAALADSCTVIRIDLPGHGRSSEAAVLQQAGWNVASLADQVAPRVPRGAAVLGWSLGGQVAMELAARAGEHAGPLLLLATTPRFLAAPALHWAAGLDPIVLARFARLLQQDLRVTIRDFLDLQVRGSRAADLTLQALQHALTQQGLPSPGAMARGLEMLRDTDLRARLACIAAPTLVLHGQYDRVTPPAAAAALAAAISGARRLELPRCGHAPFLSHAGEVATAIRAHLAAAAANTANAAAAGA